MNANLKMLERKRKIFARDSRVVNMIRRIRNPARIKNVPVWLNRRMRKETIRFPARPPHHISSPLHGTFSKISVNKAPKRKIKIIQ